MKLIFRLFMMIAVFSFITGFGKDNPNLAKSPSSYLSTKVTKKLSNGLNEIPDPNLLVKQFTITSRGKIPIQKVNSNIKVKDKIIYPDYLNNYKNPVLESHLYYRCISSNI